MVFLIRSLSRSAEGREIVRQARVEGDRLTIGRDPGSDIHLTDLAVALRHAVVERGPDGLHVRAEGGLTVELDGRKVGEGAVNPATGGDLLIGTHAIRFFPETGGGDVSVEVERVGAGAAGLGDGVARRFTLAAVLPGKRLAAWLAALLVLGLCIGWPLKSWYDRQQRAETFARFHADALWSSGSLSAAHASLKDDCTACHVRPFEAVRDAACKSCHTAVHDHADPFRLARAAPDVGRWRRIELTFRQAFDIPPGRCVDCHTEHEGPREMPATAQRFCSDCHAGLKSRLPDARIADAGDFGRSHPEFQPALVTGWNGTRPAVRRLSLAARPREASNLNFPHDLHLAPTGGPAQMARRLGAAFGFGRGLACKDCHVPDASGIRFRPVDMEGDCAMCHSLALDRGAGAGGRTLPHGRPAEVVATLRSFYAGRDAPPAVLAPAARRRPGDAPDLHNRLQFARGSRSPEEAVRAVFSRGGACWDCHRVEAPPPGSLAYGIRPVALPARYLRKGWFDHRAHSAESCSSCHAAEGSSTAADLLIPDLASCRTCHGGEGSASRVPSSCAMCHDYHMDGGAPAMIRRGKLGAAVAAAKRGGG